MIGTVGREWKGSAAGRSVLVKEYCLIDEILFGDVYPECLVLGFQV